MGNFKTNILYYKFTDVKFIGKKLIYFFGFNYMRNIKNN